MSEFDDIEEITAITKGIKVAAHNALWAIRKANRTAPLNNGEQEKYVELAKAFLGRVTIDAKYVTSMILTMEGHT